MARKKLIVSLDGELTEEVRATASRRGISEDELIEAAVKRYLGIESQERVWERNAALSEDEAMALAVEVVHEVRAEHQQR
jgi:hypothetical protein